MIKGHPFIAIEMGKSIGMALPSFDNYVINFDEIVLTLGKFYSAAETNPLNKENIKWLFNSMIYREWYC